MQILRTNTPFKIHAVSVFSKRRNTKNREAYFESLSIKEAYRER